MTTYEITVDGVHAATVHVKHHVEVATHAAAIRKVWDTPIEIDPQIGPIYLDCEPGGVEIVARIVRMR
jgi:hypothetical protein